MVGYRMRQVPEHQRGVKLNLLDYIARDAKGDPVISQEPVCDWVTWLRVKKRLEESKTSRTRRPWGSHEWLLTGLVFCQCGDRLYGHNKTRGRASGEKYQQYAYRCMANRKRGRGHCDIACVIDAAQGEAHVLGWFFAQLTDESVARARAQRRATNSDQALKSLFTSLEEARAERDELLARQGSQEFKGNMVRLLVSLLGDVEARIEKTAATDRCHGPRPHSDRRPGGAGCQLERALAEPASVAATTAHPPHRHCARARTRFRADDHHSGGHLSLRVSRPYWRAP